MKKRPFDIAQYQIYPIRDWEKFERLCLDLWKEILGDSNTQRVGRSGQRQKGVDIIGTSSITGKKVGIQCKKKDITYADETLTKKEIQEIVEEAKLFKPPLAEFVIAYIGKRDAELQEEARLITENHLLCGLFSVHIVSWEDILERLGDYRHVFSKHFPMYEGINLDVDELEKRVATPPDTNKKEMYVSSGARLPSNVTDLVREIAQSVADSVAVTNEYDAEIDHARDLINERKPREALDYLEKLEKRIWHKTDRLRRFRITTNKASALSLLGQEEESGRLFIEAHQYNQDDEKALCNRAFGHLLLNQSPQAEEFAKKVLANNPSSARAYGILVNCIEKSKPLEEVIQSVPVNLREKEDVAIAIAHAARERGDLESAILWLRRTREDVEKSGKNKNPDLLANLAATILQYFMDRYELRNNIQITTKDKERLEEVVALFTEAINAVTSVTLAYRTNWLSNRSIAYKLIGRLDQAEADMEYVLRLRPNDATMIKQYAFILYLNKKHSRAIDLLHTVLRNPEVPESGLVLAEILQDSGKWEEAKNILESTPIDSCDPLLKIEMQRLLIHIHIRLSELARAREISLSMRQADPSNVLNLVYAARIEKSDENPDSAMSLLDEALRYVNDKTPVYHVMELSDELYANERYPDAWLLYERIVDPQVDTYLVRNLLYSYYRSGEIGKAIDFSKRIPIENKNSVLMQIELAVLEDAGDLKSASQTAERYLETYPEDIQTRIHLATIWFRTDQLEKLDIFLQQDFDISKLSLSAGYQIAGLCGERNLTEKSLKIAYDLRRAYYDVGEAHLKYVGVFFSGESKFDSLLLSAEEAKSGMAVCTTNDFGQDTWYILEDRDDLNSAMGELSTSSNLGGKIVGRKIGDEIITSEGSIDKVIIRLREIKNKYVHALHESLRLLPERFGDTKGIERVTFKNGTEEEKGESIQKILGSVEKRHEYVLQAEKFYNDSKLTVGAFAQLIQSNVIDLWNGLVGSKWGIKSCLGTLEERQKAFNLLTKNKIVAIDITSILTAETLNILTLLEKRFNKILVAQSTLDLLLDAISDRKGIGTSGYFTIGKQENGFVRDEISPENIKKQFEYLENIKTWVREHCEFTPLRTGPRQERDDNLKKMLGASFFDTILIAKEQECPLYTDDFGTKMIAFNEFEVESFWTQAMLMAAVDDKQISGEEYNEAVIQLLYLKYRHTTISGKVILHAAKKSSWSNKDAFEKVLESLRGTQMEIRSIIGVFVEFVFELWQQPVLDIRRETLLIATMDAISYQRDIRSLVHVIRGAIKTRFALLPLAEARVQQVISAWEALRITL